MDSMKLTATQKEELAYWWISERTRTMGYNAGELHANKGTLDSLHRKGLIERPHYAVATTYCAKLTDDGRKVAERCAGELGLLP